MSLKTIQANYIKYLIKLDKKFYFLDYLMCIEIIVDLQENKGRNIRYVVFLNYGRYRIGNNLNS